MPLVVRWYVRLALVYFALGLFLGLLLALGASLPFLPPGFSPVYFHLLLLGWISQLIMGIALWMFPRYSAAQPRRSELLCWLTFGLLNGGLALRAVMEPLNSLYPRTAWGWGLVLSAFLQWLAGLLFVVNIWPRVRGK